MQVVEHNRRVADLITGLALVAKAVSAADEADPVVVRVAGGRRGTGVVAAITKMVSEPEEAFEPLARQQDHQRQPL